MVSRRIRVAWVTHLELDPVTAKRQHLRDTKRLRNDYETKSGRKCDAMDTRGEPRNVARWSNRRGLIKSSGETWRGDDYSKTNETIPSLAPGEPVKNSQWHRLSPRKRSHWSISRATLITIGQKKRPRKPVISIPPTFFLLSLSNKFPPSSRRPNFRKYHGRDLVRVTVKREGNFIPPRVELSKQDELLEMDEWKRKGRLERFTERASEKGEEKASGGGVRTDGGRYYMASTGPR